MCFFQELFRVHARANIEGIDKWCKAMWIVVNVNGKQQVVLTKYYIYSREVSLIDHNGRYIDRCMNHIA